MFQKQTLTRLACSQILCTRLMLLWKLFHLHLNKNCLDNQAFLLGAFPALSHCGNTVFSAICIKMQFLPYIYTGINDSKFLFFLGIELQEDLQLIFAGRNRYILFTRNWWISTRTTLHINLQMFRSCVWESLRVCGTLSTDFTSLLLKKDPPTLIENRISSWIFQWRSVDEI